MNKVDIVRKIYETAGIEEDQAASVFEQVLELLKATLKSGEPINIMGFGKFSVREKKAREGRNPRTGEAVMVSARRAISFHASPLFKEYVNGPAIPPEAIYERASKGVQAAAIEGAA